MNASCLFCRIVRSEIPCHRVYESDTLLAFLDIAPSSRGHTLLIPKQHAATLPELDPASLEALGAALPRVGEAVVAAVGADGFNVLQNNGSAAGQVVPHVHYHIVPRKEGDGLHMLPRPGKSLETDDAAELLSKIHM